MKNLIIYQSFLGSGKKYAEWLGQEIKGEVKSYRQVKKEELEKAEKIILVGATYAGWIPLGGFIKRNQAILNKKKTFFVNVGMAPENDTWNQKSWLKLPSEFRKNAKIYKLIGAMSQEEKTAIRKDNLNKIIKDIV